VPDLVLSPPVIGLVVMLALTTLYKIALPMKPPWYRGLPGALLAAVVFLVGVTGLRLYLNWLTGTGYTYGALAAPIAFLLGTFFIGMAIVLGAHFNASIQALWPVPLSDRRNRLARAAAAVSGEPQPAATPTTVVPAAVPGMLLTPDVAVLERAVRERPDVAAAVLEQLRYRVVDTGVASDGKGSDGKGSDGKGSDGEGADGEGADGGGNGAATVTTPPERTGAGGDVERR
jgi:membrane protein